jgi:peptidoglycan-associated lipoprotein
MRNLSSLALIVSSAILLAACSSPVKLDDKAKIEDRSGTSGAADARSVNPVTAGSSDELNNPQGILSKRSIYFDFDSYSIKDRQQDSQDPHSRQYR